MNFALALATIILATAGFVMLFLFLPAPAVLCNARRTCIIAILHLVFRDSVTEQQTPSGLWWHYTNNIAVSDPSLVIKNKSAVQLASLLAQREAQRTGKPFRFAFHVRTQRERPDVYVFAHHHPDARRSIIAADLARDESTRGPLLARLVSSRAVSGLSLMLRPTKVAPEAAVS
jgi:hypothetical protein